MPDVASVGTAQDAETAHVPQSIKPVVVPEAQAGWLWGSATDGVTVATLRAPSPP